MATTSISGTTWASSARCAHRDATGSRPIRDSDAADGVPRVRIVEMSVAEAANVPALATNATQSEDTASRRAPTAGPVTTPRSCTVCSKRVGRPEPRLTDETRQQRDRRGPLCGPGRRGHAAVSAITKTTGPSAATTAASPSMRTHRSTSPTSRHRAAVVSIGDRPADRTEQDVRQQPADRGRADPRRGLSRLDRRRRARRR